MDIAMSEVEYVGQGTYYDRALKAYFRTFGSQSDIPASTDSGEYEYEGRRYVILRNVKGFLAIYRITNNGTLKRLKRYPRVFDEEL